MMTKTYTVYCLHFTTPLHIGDTRDDYGISLRTISSDTLYAALTATLAKMGESLPNDGYLGCTISSLFPYYQESEQAEPQYYFPRPLSAKLGEGLTPAEMKAAKKTVWLSQANFEQVLAGHPMAAESAELPFVGSEVSERVEVSRCGEDSRPFYMDRLYFKDYSGLFFMTEGDTSLIDRAMPLLAAEGIGTDRNVGNGFFECSKHELTLQLPSDDETVLSLSVFIPEDKAQLEHMLGGSAAYSLVRRGGWITTPPHNTYRKNAIYAFEAGSVFCGLKSGDGKIADLAPRGLVNHPVWRCGKTLVLPINTGSHE